MSFTFSLVPSLLLPCLLCPVFVPLEKINLLCVESLVLVCPVRTPVFSQIESENILPVSEGWSPLSVTELQRSSVGSRPALHLWDPVSNPTNQSTNQSSQQANCPWEQLPGKPFPTEIPRAHAWYKRVCSVREAGRAAIWWNLNPELQLTASASQVSFWWMSVSFQFDDFCSFT